jgi:glycosyltransferase involved in cell wall biosynthesis
MSPGLVSILIPCFNAEEFVGEAIESALSQDYTSFEVIVLDDGSTDNSRQVIRQHASDPRFSWESGPNAGGNAARNRLLQMSRGEFVQWLDADDILLPDKIARQVAVFDRDVDMVFCNYLELDVPNCESERIVKKPPLSKDILTYFILEGAITMLPLHRRNALIFVNGFDERLRSCQEYDLHLRLALQTWRTIVHVEEPLCCKRQVSSSVSSYEREVFSTMSGLLQSLYSRLMNDGGATPERVEAIASVLYQCGRHLVREGDLDEAKRAFQCSKRIAPNGALPVTRTMKKLTDLVGPVAAERFRSVARRVLRS